MPYDTVPFRSLIGPVSLVGAGGPDCYTILRCASIQKYAHNSSIAASVHMISIIYLPSFPERRNTATPSNSSPPIAIPAGSGT